MTFFANIDCFMIVMPNNEASQYYANFCKPSWERVGVRVNIFDAVTPTTLHRHNQLTFSKYSNAVKYTSKGLKAPFTDTEKACWYSHFILWQECCYMNSPILILEHDTYLEHPENLWYDDNYGIIFYDKAAMGSYIIQPFFAKKLVDYVMTNVIDVGPYSTIHSFGQNYPSLQSLIVNNLHVNYNPASNQVLSSRYGNTIEHYCNMFPEHWPADHFHTFKDIE